MSSQPADVKTELVFDRPTAGLMFYSSSHWLSFTDWAIHMTQPIQMDWLGLDEPAKLSRADASGETFKLVFNWSDLDHVLAELDKYGFEPLLVPSDR